MRTQRQRRRSIAHVSLQGLALFTCVVLGTACATVPNVPAGPPAEIHLAADSASNKYQVRMVDAAGKASDCQTPCTLQVSSGTGELDIQGSGKFKQKLVVPEGASDASIQQINKVTYNAGYGLLVASLILLGYTIIVVKDSNTIILLSSITIGLDVGALILFLVSGKNDVTLTPGKPSATTPPTPPPSPSPAPSTEPAPAPPQSRLFPRINLARTTDNRGGGLTIGWAF